MEKIKRVYLEITNACNLDCPFCSNEKGHSFMSLDVVKDYLNQIKEISDYVYLHVLGEPTLHPDFDAIMDYCEEINLHVQLVTNGTLLVKHPHLFENKALRKCSISLHSINNSQMKEEYFNFILNLLNKPLNATLELRFYDFNNLDNDLKTFLNELQNVFGLKLTDKVNSYKLKENVYVYFNELFDWPKMSDKTISNHGKCHGAIDQIAILHNGLVTTCCLDPYGQNYFGDLKKNSLKEILSSKQYQEIVTNLRKQVLILDLCKKCSYRTRFK